MREFFGFFRQKRKNRRCDHKDAVMTQSSASASLQNEQRTQNRTQHLQQRRQFKQRPVRRVLFHRIRGFLENIFF